MTDRVDLPESRLRLRSIRWRDGRGSLTVVHRREPTYRRKFRQGLKRAIERCSGLDDIAGYVVLTWDSHGRYTSSWSIAGGVSPISATQMPSFVRDALLRDRIEANIEDSLEIDLPQGD